MSLSLNWVVENRVKKKERKTRHNYLQFFVLKHANVKHNIMYEHILSHIVCNSI